jgi:hypothetical protein
VHIDQLFCRMLSRDVLNNAGTDLISWDSSALFMRMDRIPDFALPPPSSWRCILIGKIRCCYLLWLFIHYQDKQQHLLQHICCRLQ